MEDKRDSADRLAGLEGTDAASLGLTPPPEPASPAAEVVDEVNLVPGADFGREVTGEAKPWSSSLAYESDQAGVANQPQPTGDEEQFPTGDDEAL